MISNIDDILSQNPELKKVVDALNIPLDCLEEPYGDYSENMININFGKLKEYDEDEMNYDAVSIDYILISQPDEDEPEEDRLIEPSQLGTFSYNVDNDNESHLNAEEILKVIPRILSSYKLDPSQIVYSKNEAIEHISKLSDNVKIIIEVVK